MSDYLKIQSDGNALSSLEDACMDICDNDINSTLIQVFNKFTATYKNLPLGLLKSLFGNFNKIWEKCCNKPSSDGKCPFKHKDKAGFYYAMKEVIQANDPDYLKEDIISDEDESEETDEQSTNETLELCKRLLSMLYHQYIYVNVSL